MSDLLAVDYHKFTDLLALERDLLVQYQQLAIKLKVLADEISKLTKRATSSHDSLLTPPPPPADSLLSNLRNLERKIGLVYTLFKTAVYSMQLRNKEMIEYAGEDYVEPLLSEPDDDTLQKLHG